MLIETERLRLRLLRDDDADAAAMLELLNDPGFHRYIGDRGIRTLEQARDCVRDGPLASYSRHGYGMYAVERRSDGVWLGNAGLVHRAALPHPDIGYALLERHAGQGYALEAARAVLGHARGSLGLGALCAIVAQGNARSVALLEKLGFRAAGTTRLPGKEEELLLFFNEPGDCG
ncbi:MULTISPECIES: GNAT family N-acetyltransferase [Stenotrophomonas]|uniref:Acetyltransferase n=1 Tax=Stenotrophomonas nitritireducens TaxID=83617 RepID=A0ABR5NHH0_9GAMM|nr:MULTISPECIES: GNAT family N-acetyltransferase [Stenotrophomonas]KQN97996.1 acetyltransferase [Stenotrophomonas sp. Leaf70]KRG55653.1 acetyltransferase [Stenotrophomonas nitritireducens]